MTENTNPFGVLAFFHWNHKWNDFHFNDATLVQACQQLKEIGIGMVRTDILWSDVRSSNSTFNFSKYDRIIEVMKQNDLEPLVILHYNKVAFDSNEEEKWNSPPKNLNEFANYVYETVDHFKNKIHYWEIWNEPNLSDYWNAPKDGLKIYSQLLKKSYAACKKADPNCTVLNGGLTEPVIEDVTNLYGQGCQPFFDILNLHTFVYPKRHDRDSFFKGILDGVSEIMKRNGDKDKKIWITEIGCPGIPNGKPQSRWFAGGPINEQEQADWVKWVYTHGLAHPTVQKVFWAFYRDTPNQFHEATDYFGLVRLDLSPKPSFKQLQRLIEDWKIRALAG